MVSSEYFIDDDVDVDDVVIDPETGLPVLEDGMFWVVSRVEEKVRSSVPDYLRVSIKRKAKKERRSISTLYLTKETYFEEEEVEGRNLIDYVTPFTLGMVDQYRSEGYTRVSPEDSFDYSYPMVRYWDQTEENVAKAAREVYAKHQERLRKAKLDLKKEAEALRKIEEDRVRMEILIGSYPPKKLGGR